MASCCISHSSLWLSHWPDQWDIDEDRWWLTWGSSCVCTESQWQIVLWETWILTSTQVHVQLSLCYTHCLCMVFLKWDFACLVLHYFGIEEPEQVWSWQEQNDCRDHCSSKKSSEKSYKLILSTMSLPNVWKTLWSNLPWWWVWNSVSEHPLAKTQGCESFCHPNQLHWSSHHIWQW
jgi:hypothetical protein